MAVITVLIGAKIGGANDTERIPGTLEGSGLARSFGEQSPFADAEDFVPSLPVLPEPPSAGSEVVSVLSVAPTPEPPTYSDTPRGALAALVAAWFPDDPYMATHVVWAESIGDWNKNWECTVYGGCWSVTNDCGLLQIHWAAHYDKFWRRGWTEADCWIPERNVEIAREVYDASGGTAWTTY